MKDVYDPKNLVEPYVDEDGDEDYIPMEKYIEWKDDQFFHVGQSYENKVASTVFCKHCGGKEFNVAIGSYFTAIRCVECEWEKCVHDG